MATTSELVDCIAAATTAYANAVTNEMALEDRRIEVKMAAVGRIMAAGDNPLTGKAHSFSSAEALVNTDAEYAEYLSTIREAVKQRIIARGNYDAALVAAQLTANQK
jgi:hypothetical protein